MASALAPCVEPLEMRAYLSIALAPATEYGGVGSPAGIATANFVTYAPTPMTDIAVAGVDPNTHIPAVAVYLGNAAPIYYDLKGDNSAQDILTGDFNGDGNTDIAVTDPTDGAVSVLLGNGDGTFQAPITTSYGTAQPIGTTATADLASGDFNDDGFTDLAVTDPADHQIAILLGNGDGTFKLGTPITSTEASFDPQHIATADFNGDSYPDLVFNDGTAAQIDLVDGNGAGGFSAPIVTTVGGAVQGLAVADVNGDGAPDLVVSVSTSAGSGAVDVLLNSDGAFAPAQPLPTTFADPGPVAVGNIDGDGPEDIVTLNSTGALDLFLNAGSGVFGLAIQSQATTAGMPQAMVTADVNGNGKSDVLFTEINPGLSGGGGYGVVFGAAQPEISPGISGALPVAVVPGQKTSIVQTLSLEDAVETNVLGKVTVSIALSSDGSYSPADPILDAISVNGKIEVGTSKLRQVKIAEVPADVAPGNYFLVVQATDPTGATATGSSTDTLNVVAPQIELSGAFKKFPNSAKAGKALGASITVTNNGNVPVVGLLPIVVDSSTENELDDTAVQALSLNKKVDLKPGKSITIQLSRLIAPSAAGAYYLIVQLDPGNTLGETNVANNTFATGAAIQVS